MPRAHAPTRLSELAAEIARRGLTLAAVSHQVGIHAQYLSHIIRGHAQPSQAVVERIADALETDPQRLFGVPA